ncbi:13620_t:CDS:2, partial [Dentiscutata heterogama]
NERHNSLDNLEDLTPEGIIEDSSEKCLRNLYADNERYDYVISSLPDHKFTQVPNDNSTTNSSNSNNSNETKQLELGPLFHDH